VGPARIPGSAGSGCALHRDGRPVLRGRLFDQKRFHNPA